MAWFQTVSWLNILHYSYQFSQNIILASQKVKQKLVRKTSLLLLIIVSFFAFFRLGDHPIQDWDEARHGINAIEMLQNGDWVNLHFKGRPDNWNVKPPLAIWAIAGSYSIFGVNDWALRIPSALSIILAFFFLYKIIRLYRSEQFAFSTCLILVSIKGWIGYHVGRTGDTDAMLVAFLMGGSFFFLKYMKSEKNVKLLLSAMFFGFAFLTKGFAMMVFVPSILLFSFFTNQLRFLFFQKATYFALLLFMIFPFGWFWINTQFGISFLEKEGLGSNAFTSMIFYDLVERFSNPDFIDPASSHTKLFFFTYLDTRFNVWNYFFFGGIFVILVSLFLKKITAKQILSKLKSPLILISICWAAPLIVFQNFANVQHHWYLAPALPFIAIITCEIIFWLKKQFPFFKYLFFGALAFTLIRQATMFNSPDQKPKFILENQAILTTGKRIINLVPYSSQSLTLYLYQCNRNQVFVNSFSELKNNLDDSDLLFIRKKDWELLLNATQFDNISTSKESEFCILKRN